MRARHIVLLLAAASLMLSAGCSTAQSQSRSADAVAQPTASSASQPASSGTTAMKSVSSNAPLSANASAGEKIWAAAQGATGTITFVGGSDDVGNGACANCHGDKAQGGDGPMIGWSMLTAKNSTMAGMPKFSYSSPDQVYASVTTGVRPNGTKLKPAMPRYSLSRTDFDQLIAFLKTK